MRMKFTKTLTFFMVACVLTAGHLQAKTKISCIGNSITEGYSNYPTHLGRMLGDEYEVGNFGKGGSGVFSDREWDYVYPNTEQCEAAIAFQPDIVIIKFGANDSGNDFWDKPDAAATFKEDYTLLVNKFLALSPQPEIHLCQVPPIFPDAYFWSGTERDRILREQMQPIIREIAEELGCKVIDLYTPLLDKRDYFPDDLHPNHRGAYIIAQQVYESITGQPFSVNRGGVTIQASGIDTEGTEITYHADGYLEGGADGRQVSFTIDFGSVPYYSLIRVEGKKNTASSGQFDFYLEGENSPFVSVPVENMSSQTFSVEEMLYTHKLTGLHTINMVWNAHDASVKSITFKEELAPFLAEEEKEYYIVNISNGRVLDTRTEEVDVNTGLLLAEYDPSKESQIFGFDHFGFDLYRIRHQASGLYVRNNTNSVILDIPEGSDINWFGFFASECSWYIEAHEDNKFSIQVPEGKYIGRRGEAFPSVILGNKKLPLEEVDYWRIVEKEKMSSSVPGITPDTDVQITGVWGAIRINNMRETDDVSVYNLLGYALYGQVARTSSLSVSMPAGIYLVTVRTDSGTIVRKVLVD